MQRLRSRMVLFTGIACILMNTCSPFQPEPESGTICIEIERNQEGDSLGKYAVQLSRLQCILKRGEATVTNKFYSRKDDYFQIIIRHLLPADNYSIMLWGFDEEKTLLGRGKSEHIIIKKEKVTHVKLSWVPFKLQLTSPQDNSITNNSQPVFDWNSIENALLYEVQIDTTLSYSSSAGITIHTADSYYQPPDPLKDARYYWHVRCQDGDGVWSPYTHSAEVRIKTHGPPPPELISPPTGSSLSRAGSLLFDWSDVIGAASYTMEISTSESFTENYYVMGGFTNSEVDIYLSPYLYSTGTYYWHVSARDSLGTKGDWSQPFTFYIPASPPTGSSISHAGSILFDWSDVQGVRSYTLEISDSESFIESDYSMDGFTDSEAEIYFSPSLYSAGTYYWHVAATDNFGTKLNWSQPGIFYISYSE